MSLARPGLCPSSDYSKLQVSSILAGWVRYHVTLKWGSGGRTGSGQVEARGGAGGEEGNIADHYRRVIRVTTVTMESNGNPISLQ